MEGGRVQLSNTEGGIDGCEEFSNKVGAVVGQEVVWFAKVLYRMRQKGISHDGSGFLGQGAVLVRLVYQSVISRTNQLPESALREDQGSTFPKILTGR